MKKWIALLLVCLLPLCAQASAETFSNYGTVIVNNAALLSSASSEGSIVCLLPVSTIVYIARQSLTDNILWYELDDLNGHAGYMVSSNVRLLSAEEAARLGLPGGRAIGVGGGTDDSEGARGSVIGGIIAPVPTAVPAPNATLVPTWSVALQGYSYARGYQHVSFGRYPTGKLGNTQPIRWRVLTAGDGTALLWSDLILDCQPYLYQAYEDEPPRSCSFTASDLYQFLNSDFIYTAFTNAERMALCYTTRGYAFVLDADDLTCAAYGFQPSPDADDLNRAAQCTGYAAAMGCYVNPADGGCNYWVSSISGDYIGNMHYSGSMGRAKAFRDNIGVRVAILVNTNAMTAELCQSVGFDR